MHSFQFIVKVKCQAVIRWCLRNISQMPPTYLRRPAHQLDVMIEIVIRWLHLLEKHLEFIKILKHLFQIDLKNIRISLTISIFLKWTIQYSVVWGFKCVTCNNMHIIPRKHVFNIFYKVWSRRLQVPRTPWRFISGDWVQNISGSVGCNNKYCSPNKMNWIWYCMNFTLSRHSAY